MACSPSQAISAIQARSAVCFHGLVGTLPAPSASLWASADQLFAKVAIHDRR
jgi:hypothetical protein